MAQLAALAPYFEAAATAISVGAAIRQGQQAKVQGAIQTRELREDAAANQATAQREAIVRRRQGAFAASRARAIAAASGAGVSDTTSDILIGRIEAQSDANVLNALYEGDATARGLRTGAAKATREGRAAASAGLYKAGGSAISGATSFYDKYGGRFKSSTGSGGDLDYGTALADYARQPTGAFG